MNELKKEISGFGAYKCNKCNISHMGLKNIKNICPKCFILEIIIQSKKDYVNYLKNVTKLEKANTITKDDFNNLFLNNISINYDNKKYSIYEAIEELNYQENNKEFDAEKTLYDIIIELKQQICLYCNNDVQNIEFRLPCGCNFCSFNHLESFIKEKIQNKLTNNYKCFCSYEYKPNTVLELCNFLRSKNIYKDYANFIERLNDLFDKICFICGCEKNDLEKVDIQGFCPNNYNHFVCEECIQNESSNYIKCSICGIQHKYILNNF
jgi:hypothetical protein